MSFDLLGVGRWVAAPRFGKRKGGFPPGGPWDEESFALACALAGAEEAFELDTGSLTFQAQSRWAIVGAGRGELADFAAGEGLASPRRVYLALKEPSPPQGGEGRVRVGGATCTLSASSSALPRGPSLHPPGALLRSIPRRTLLSPRGERGSRSGAPLQLAHPPEQASVLRVLPGPQSGLLDRLLERDLTIDRLSDRTGLRLSKVEPHAVEIPSEPATFGAIQLTPNGTPILLGPDGPTLGGYPKPAVVIRADRARAGRLMPGDPVRLTLVTREEAETLWRDERNLRARRVREIELGLNVGGFRTS